MRTIQLSLIGTLLAALLVAAFLIAAVGSLLPPTVPAIEAGKLILGSSHEGERPAVLFDHDAHTKALGNAPCDSCHHRDAAGVPQVVEQPLAEESVAPSLAETHGKCMTCHEDRLSENLSAGPTTACGDCHSLANNALGKDARDLFFDRHRHAQHEAVLQPELGRSSCASCHHRYDDQRKALYEAPGKESSCRECHEEASTPTVRGLRQAVHQNCVTCHLQRLGLQKKSGPVDCAGCHSSTTPRDWTTVPRLLRGQPEVATIHTMSSAMAAVGFNHAAHESREGTCRVCHHDTLERCVVCHALGKGRDLQTVKLATAHHTPRDPRSCVGCHELEKQEPACRGCHDRPLQELPTTSCGLCHDGGPGVTEVSSDESAPTTSSSRTGALLAAFQDLSSDALPETLRLDLLAAEYEPSIFPHRKIIQTLLQKLEASSLAQHFHPELATLCSGCHHHQQPSQALHYARCAACHGQDDEDRRPGLLGALHQQCLGCHQRMNLGHTGCEDCHRRRPQQDEVR
ncbi:MAG: hypothetical protein A2284_06150 [Deltaproteobacteria bacterium RIFOXYA12_FULL_61_11]|nr:MAG: hypothetical protein A2284_06150 [Deltaproteobacteria bacterium RIFOXYA12_FULL_61_11]